MTKRRLTATLGSLLALSAFAPGAAASKSYPEDLRKKLELPAIVGPAPGCRLCHKDDEGGLHNVNRPFGLSLMQEGASGANIPSLLAALDTLAAQGTDSDGDGTGDIAELEAGTDPNVGADGSVPLHQVPLPETGCAIAVASGSSVGRGLLGVLLGAALLARRRRPGVGSGA